MLQTTHTYRHLRTSLPLIAVVLVSAVTSAANDQGADADGALRTQGFEYRPGAHIRVRATASCALYDCYDEGDVSEGGPGLTILQLPQEIGVAASIDEGYCCEGGSCPDPPEHCAFHEAGAFPVLSGAAGATQFSLRFWGSQPTLVSAETTGDCTGCWAWPGEMYCVAPQAGASASSLHDAVVPFELQDDRLITLNVSGLKGCPGALFAKICPRSSCISPILQLTGPGEISALVSSGEYKLDLSLQGALDSPGPDCPLYFDEQCINDLTVTVAVALPRLGDLNCDGLVNNGDIDPFVLALTDPSGYAATFPNCDIDLADINGDGVVNNGDIDGFVTLLSGV